MADTPSSILLLRLQSTGSNTNLWGGYLNTIFSTQERATKGYQALAVTGDATISWANYSASNTGAVARLRLTGSLSSAATLTFPAYQNYLNVDNAAGAAVTIKCSGGTGVTIANSGKQLIYCDGTDYYSASPNVLGTGTVTVAGRIAGVTAGTAATDAVNKNQMETAIATAGLPATAGTVLVSVGDTTAGYLGQKIAVAGDLVASIQNPGADEDVLITHTPYWNTPRYVATADSPATALDRDILFVDTTGAVEIDLPASGRVWIIDRTGNAPTNNITVDPAGADTTTIGTIDLAYFSAVFTRNASGNWDIS